MLHKPLVPLLCLLTACTPFAANDTRPSLSFPARYAEAPAGTARQGVPGEQFGNTLVSSTQTNADAWWRNFHSQELDTLMAAALGNNFDLHAAAARLRQARASARKQGAGRLPALDLGDTAATHQRRDAGGSGPSDSDTLSLGLAASYELDLWGRIASQYEAAQLRMQASQEDLESAIMTVAASVADTWLALAGARAELAVLDRQIETNTLLTQTLALRFANAMRSGLDVLQQQELLVASQAERPSLEQEIQNLQTTLAILLGRLPGTEPHVDTTTLPPLPPLPPLGLPADALAARPDIRAAWARLAAARRDVNAAQADRFPALRLTANGSFSGEGGSLFSNWLLNLAAGLSGPLFDGGKRAAETDRTRAVVAELVQTYGKTVAQALKDVEDALGNETRQQARLLKLQEQLRYAEVARDEARTSYFGGRDTFLRYITQLQGVQKLERTVIREQSSLLRFRVSLYRALGGDWTRTLALNEPPLPPAGATPNAEKGESRSTAAPGASPKD